MPFSTKMTMEALNMGTAQPKSRSVLNDMNTTMAMSDTKPTSTYNDTISIYVHQQTARNHIHDVINSAIANYK